MAATAAGCRNGAGVVRGIFFHPRSLSFFFFGTLDRWTLAEPGLARAGPSSTALNYGCAVYPHAENRLIGIIGSRGRKLTAVSMSAPRIISLPQVAVEKGAI